MNLGTGLPTDIRFLPHSSLPVKWRRKKGERWNADNGEEKLDRKKMMIILISPKQNKKPIFAQSGHVYAMLVNNNPLKYLMF